MTHDLTCAQCGQPIEDGKYFVVGIDLRQSPPPCVYVHGNGCVAKWQAEHPDGVLRNGQTGKSR